MIEQGFMDDIDTDVCGDLFDHIDYLLDFPNEDIGGGDVGGLESCWPTAPDVLTLSGSTHGSGSTSQSQSIDDGLAAELSVPCEDIAHLEWLSNFVEDSFSAGSMDLDKDLIINNNNNNNNEDSQFQTSSPVSVLESSSSCTEKLMLLRPDKVVPGRARSKRPRPLSFSSRNVPHSLVSPASSDSTDLSSPFLPDFKNFAESHPHMKTPKKKKLAPLPFDAASDDAAAAAQPSAVRKCMHCEIQKTPQWRMGPLGPKTLCNACGVRYKSGRLYPEYRPAASPTFVSTLHSNSHKKVVEMRVKSGQKAPAPTPEFVRKTSHLMLDCA